MNIAFFIAIFSTLLVSCAGDTVDNNVPVEHDEGVIKDVSAGQEHSNQVTQQPPSQPEDDNPCGYQDIVLEDPTNSINNVVITIEIPCSPYYIDEGRPLPIIKK